MPLVFCAPVWKLLKPSEAGINQAGLELREFEREHPGVYAMGDRAGVVGYLLKAPGVQLEGLVMSPVYLARLKTASSIEELLDAYGVDYYVATNPVRLQNGNLGSGEARPVPRLFSPSKIRPYLAHCQGLHLQHEGRRPKHRTNSHRHIRAP